MDLVVVRQNWGNDLVYYHDEEGGRLHRMPISWTDLAEEDLIATLGAGRTPFRLADLIELTRLVGAIAQEWGLRGGPECV